MSTGSQNICLDTFSKLTKTERLEAIKLLIKKFDSFDEIESFIELLDNRLVNPTTQRKSEIISDLGKLSGRKRKSSCNVLNKSEVKNIGVKQAKRTSINLPYGQLKQKIKRKMQFSCGKCGEPFSSVKDHGLHIERCNGASDKLFDNRDDRNIGTKVHKGGKPYECSECFKTFWEASKLKVHGVVHSGQKPFSCDKCNKKFASRGSCYNHKKRFHDGNKPFTCDFCEKSWAIKIDLILHRRIHTGEKPHTCYVCQMKFSRSSSLILHQKLCTGTKKDKELRKHCTGRKKDKKSSKINRFSCSICSKTFPKSRNLFRHNMLHTGEKPHSCKVCGKAYIQKISLKKHIKAVHDKEN